MDSDTSGCLEVFVCLFVCYLLASCSLHVTCKLISLICTAAIDYLHVPPGQFVIDFSSKARPVDVQKNPLSSVLCHYLLDIVNMLKQGTLAHMDD